jgi:hypothetical protein
MRFRRQIHPLDHPPSKAIQQVGTLEHLGQEIVLSMPDQSHSPSRPLAATDADICAEGSLNV